MFVLIGIDDLWANPAEYQSSMMCCSQYLKSLMVRDTRAGKDILQAIANYDHRVEYDEARRVLMMLDGHELITFAMIPGGSIERRDVAKGGPWERLLRIDETNDLVRFEVIGDHNRVMVFQVLFENGLFHGVEFSEDNKSTKKGVSQ